jgi:hypothetical protein
MSWYISYLLFNHRAIKLKEDLEDDSFNDLLILEKKIKELLDNGFIKKEELDLLKQIINCQNIYILAKEINTDYRTLQVFLNSIISRLSMCLGSVYTDEGMINKICSTHNLTHEEIEKLRDYMSRPYKGDN